MRLLAIDTSTESCSVALRLGDAVAVRRHAGAREQTLHVLPMVEELLAEAGATLASLDAVACAQGPGAFTGVRVAVSVTQGLAFGAGIPAIGVSTLAALAAQARRRGARMPVLALLDARMGELYAGAYGPGEDGLPDALAPDYLCRPEDLPALLPAGGPFSAIGSGWAAYPHLATQIPLAGAVLVGEPDAEDVLALAARALAAGAAVPAERLLPVYLRDEVAWKKVDAQGRP